METGSNNSTRGGGWQAAPSGGLLASPPVAAGAARPREETGDTVLVVNDVYDQVELLRHLLRKQQEFLRCVIDNSPNMIYVKDRAGRFTLANHAAAAVFGTTVAALLGQREADFLPQAEDAARHERDDRAILATMDEQFIIEE